MRRIIKPFTRAKQREAVKAAATRFHKAEITSAGELDAFPQVAKESEAIKVQN